MPLYQPVDLASVSESLGGVATEGQIFKADGLGSGAMTKNIQVIKNRLTVGQVGSDCDFTPTLGYGAIYAAVATAIAGGVSSSNPWQIDIYPGVYAEPKITLPVGLYVRGSQTRMDTVFVVPVDPSDDLFVSEGGHISGLHLAGVTGAGKWLLNCSIEGSFSTALDVAIHGCSGGVLIANGAQIVCTNYSVIIGGADMNVGVAFSIDGVGAVTGMKSYAAIQGFFAVVPALVLPYYTTNPVQQGFSVTNGGEGFIATGSFRLPSIDDTSSSVFVDSGGFAFVSAVEVANAKVAIRVGASGSNSKILTQACNFQDNITDVKIESSTGKVFLSQSGDELVSDLVSGAQVIGNVQNRDGGYQAIIGNARYQYLGSGKQINFSDFFNKEVSTGLFYGGVVSAATGLHVDVSSGKGAIRRGSPEFDAWDVEWDAVTAVALTASAVNYVFYNALTEAVDVSLSAPGATGILLATVVTGSTGIRFLHQTRRLTAGLAALLGDYLDATRKVYLASGIVPSVGTGVRNINVSSGSYFLALDLVSYAGVSDATFSAFYGTNGATEVASQTQVDITQYDDAGTLTAMTSGYFRSDTLVLTSDGRLGLIYGTDEFDTQVLAEAAASGNVPTFMQASAFPVARVVVEQGVGIATFIDIRPQDGAGGGGSVGTSSHSALSELDQPGDHLWAMLVDGTRAMTGALNMGNQNITNAGTVNGVSVTAHNARHQPGGADAIPTATPTGVLVAATAGEGSATSLSRSDHQHGIATGTPQSVGAANAAGSSTSVPRLDHVHGHGNQAGGTTHAVATTSVAGFESAADKLKLDGIETGATATPLTSTAPVNVTKATAAVGTAVEAARQDHKHDVTTAAPASGAVAVGNAATEGSATSLARSDHQHAVSAGTPVNVSTANAAGSATTFARSDHAHAGLTRGAADFAAFTAKSSLGANDLILIEDGDAANVKKKVASSVLISAFTPVFGANPHYAESEGESSTTSATYQTKVTLTTGAIPAGTYHIGWYAEVRHSNTNGFMYMRVQADGTTTLCEPVVEPKDGSSYYPMSGFQQVTFATSGTHNIVMAYRNGSAGNTTYILRARLQLYRVY